ncbi:Enoyl-[acyl-carrier-protein] reductase [FMN] [Vibrio casei]|nr:Enoyl-[acyl-carrier-protein] reductase [FMN] [Vibrio casei]
MPRVVVNTFQIKKMMNMTTRITEILNIKYPLIQAPMYFRKRAIKPTYQY